VEAVQHLLCVGFSVTHLSWSGTFVQKLEVATI
jgi:hypothetical protein